MGISVSGKGISLSEVKLILNAGLLPPLEGCTNPFEGGYCILLRVFKSEPVLQPVQTFPFM